MEIRESIRKRQSKNKLPNKFAVNACGCFGQAGIYWRKNRNEIELPAPLKNDGFPHIVEIVLSIDRFSINIFQERFSSHPSLVKELDEPADWKKKTRSEMPGNCPQSAGRMAKKTSFAKKGNYWVQNQRSEHAHPRAKARALG